MRKYVHCEMSRAPGMPEVSARRKNVEERGVVSVMPERMMNQRRTREPARKIIEMRLRPRSRGGGRWGLVGVGRMGRGREPTTDSHLGGGGGGLGEMGWWLATAAPDEGATMGWSIAGVSKVIGGMFRGSIIGHGIRSMDATAREERGSWIVCFHAQKVLSWEEKRSKRSGKNGNGRTEGDRWWKGLLEEEASATRQKNGKGRR